MPLIQITLADGHKRFSFIDWFKRFEILDTGLVPGNIIMLAFPPEPNEGLPYSGFYEISTFISCSEYGPNGITDRLAQLNPHTLEIKGSGDNNFHFIDISPHYQTIGPMETVRVYNNSLKGCSIVNITAINLCSDRKVFLRFTGTQINTTYVQINGGYINLKFLGENYGGLCQN